MLRYFTLLLLVSVCCLAQEPEAKNELQQGVAAYKSADYESAALHFERATALDPKNINAHLYLATTFAQQYIPGVENPKNLQLAERATDEYKRVLELDSRNINSAKGIAYLNLQRKRFEEARTYYLKAAEIDPQDPETYYSVGVIDWIQTYQPRMERMAGLDLKPVDTERFIHHQKCWELRDRNLPVAEHGIQMLTKALDLRPDYDDAMAYMNLMYRERADIQCGDAQAYLKDVEIADKWVDLTLATKKKKTATPEPKN